MRRGKLVNRSMIKVRYSGIDSGSPDIIGGSNNDGPPAAAPLLPLLPSWIKVEVDMRAYMSKLRREVRHLHGELEATRLVREEEVRRDLLAYIQPLPRVELQRTVTMSPEVLEAMKDLVATALSGIGKGVGVGEEEEEDGGGGGGHNDNDDGGARSAGGGVGDSRIIWPDTVM
jgi:hypothetical protein